MSDPTNDSSTPQVPPAPPAAPPYGAPQTPPAYGAPQTPPAYGAPAAQPYGAGYPGAQPPAYGAAPGYPQAYGGYAAPAKTNAMAIVSLVSSIVGVTLLPFIGSLVGVITGHMSLNQLKTSGEGGRGMALAGTIVGWVGLGFCILFGIIIVFAVIAAVGSRTTYGA